MLFSFKVFVQVCNVTCVERFDERSLQRNNSITKAWNRNICNYDFSLQWPSLWRCFSYFLWKLAQLSRLPFVDLLVI